jgi:hypothetical protein
VTTTATTNGKARTRRRREPTLDELGITPEQAAKYKAIAAIPHDVVDAYNAWVGERNDDDEEMVSSPDGLLEFAGRIAAAQSYGSRPTKSGRRTKADIQAIRDVILEVVAAYRPMTVRQVFYQLVTRGVIDKTEAEYKQTVCRLLVQMRRDRDLPYGWIADNTRWMRKPDSYGSVEAMLHNCQRTYRRALWNDQDAYVEVWLEKEALAGVLVDVTAEWDVPLMVTRGYPSVSFLYSAGEQISALDCPVYLYYFGDRDPSGVDIDRFVERELRHHAPDCDLTFRRVAVLPEQIERYGLQTRPTKKTDSRSKSFRGESVEVDAIDPDTLRGLCETCITQHIDQEQLERTRAVEEAERDTLATMIVGMEGGGDE